ncbi:hypothetical protein CERSUDRAFT_89935 [Gelatoporia subvermispora B]|uniref:Brl1/Brr6 domain-containing protein n=1 Tax=Ceriporiopsis subvermispora (strain B) TaxID=914234 RepID=M2RAC7_CERS8|nr:hypothetical protein CERSUDRAFT_89935 [Gelatoporia subvermispora B]
MSRAFRSTETPMDFEFTHRPSSSMKPVWASGTEDPSTPRKRTLNDANPPTPAFPTTPQSPTYPSFGQGARAPFLFHQQPPQTPHRPPWEPPANFSPQKAFPQPEIPEIDMSELSPPKSAQSYPERDLKEPESERAVALGGLRRVFNSRQRSRARSRARSVRLADGDEDSAEEDGSDDEQHAAVMQNMSNHYTLNMPSPAPPPSDLPYILLGYLQFFFNLSLILVFLYLLIQFILTVQRDVEQRISEYSMDIVQEIAQCAMQYKTNLCASNPIPAMAHQCGLWETCMNRDPSKVGRAKVGAELIAEVVNGFVEPISWKTLAFTLTSLAFLTVFINALLSLYRSRHDPVHHAPQPHHPPAIPAFPIAPATPYPHHYLAPPPEWNKPWIKQEEEEVELPRQRRRLEGGQAAKIK